MRQGSIMSPKLFAIYVDDLTQSLIQSKIGCMVDEVYVLTTFLCGRSLSLGALCNCLAEIT